ncbi:hypothetical protein O0Q50_20820 [Priestia aryabhattai]|uniref:Transmembrane protein n=1 Tax=Priestia aryabhattai TaxID=412384 RepID=A0AAX6NCI9_PRIAR|nr:hypothetical protein [Priestia aryabhattai]MDU9693621.1 hypothetical protein [Priestia aryabhattai]
MGKYSHKSDYELEIMREQGGDSLNDSLEIEIELENRGYEQDENGYFEFEPEHKSNIHNDGSVGNEESGDGFLFKFILCAAFVIFCLFGTPIIVGYAINFSFFIYIGFILTFAFMYLGKAVLPTVNFLFYLGCFALMTRFYADLVGYWEQTNYLTFVHSDSTHFVDLLKYAVIYIFYIAIVPYLLFKTIKTITLATLNKKDKSDLDVEG